MQAPAPMSRDLRTGFRFSALLGMFAAFALFGTFAAWSFYTDINGAVIATGAVEVASRPKSVQHLDGGIIEDIQVVNGDEVQAGDVLVRLDPTLLAANLYIYQTRLAETTALANRLFAEQEGRETIDWTNPVEPVGQVNMDLIRRGEASVFASRRELQAGRREQLREKVLQFGNQIDGVESLIRSKEQQLAFLEKELAASQTLRERGLTPENAVLSLLRAQADLLGQIAEHRSELARIENSIRDTELELLQVDRQFREGVVTELRDTSTEIQELSQQIISTRKELERVEIRAPASGRIHELQFSTIGGVVPPGALITQIIPLEDALRFEVRVEPVAIEQVYPGQDARVRFPAFNQRTTPELKGEVLSISPTSVLDEATGMSFFRVSVAVQDAELMRLGEVDLVPGMPVEAYLQTGERSVLSYLAKPLTEQLNQAFRER